MDTTEDRFLELIRRNGPRLRRIARVYGRGPMDAEDLHQEILTQLWRSFPSFRGDSTVDTWVYRVALNTSLAHRRRQQARPEEPMDPAQERYAAAGPGPEERFEARRRLDRLYAAIDRLSELDRALTLLYLDDFSYREMAEVLGLSEANVGVRLHRVRKRLKNELTGDDQ